MNLSLLYSHFQRRIRSKDSISKKCKRIRNMKQEKVWALSNCTSVANSSDLGSSQDLLVQSDVHATGEQCKNLMHCESEHSFPDCQLP